MKYKDYQRKCFDESTFKWIVAYYIISVNVRVFIHPTLETEKIVDVTH
jgi:hypothetical protein